MVLRFRACPRRSLGLLTLLCGAFASSLSAADPEILSPDTPSAILIDEAFISGQICPDPAYNVVKKGAGYTAKCRVVIKNGCEIEHLGLCLMDPVKTACGDWIGTVEFQTPHVLQGSSLAWTEAPEDPGHGLFAGAFEMPAHLHLTQTETGETAEVMLPVRFNLAGSWAVTTSASGDAAIRLQAGDEVPFEQCIPQEFAEKYDFDIIEGSCRICVNGFVIAPSNLSNQWAPH